MKDGELLFVEATANTKQEFLRERIRDVVNGVESIALLTESIIKQRAKLRVDLLASKDKLDRERIIEKFNEDLRDFEIVYLEGLVAMLQFAGHSDIKALSFLSLYARYKEIFRNVDKNMADFSINKIKIKRGVSFDVQDFLLSGWDVFVYELSRPPDDSFGWVGIDDDTVIEETDWDGVKSKQGKEIIRRNGECGGKVFAFVYVEKTSEGRNDERVLHFYSVSIDGKEMRHYTYKRSF
jgi:hypothetical protein